MVLTQHGINSISRGNLYVIIGDKKYPVVKIGNQLWTTENLDWKWDGLDLGYTTPINSSTPNAQYYNNDESTYGWDGYRCGLLYNYSAKEAMKNMLPSGWRIPSIADINTLKNFINSPDDGYLLSADAQWAPAWIGENLYGFNLKPFGAKAEWNGWTGIFCNITDAGNLHLSEFGYCFQRYIGGSASTRNSLLISTWRSYPLYPIRLVKDVPPDPVTIGN